MLCCGLAFVFVSARGRGAVDWVCVRAGMVGMVECCCEWGLFLDCFWRGGFSALFQGFLVIFWTWVVFRGSEGAFSRGGVSMSGLGGVLVVESGVGGDQERRW